MGKKLKNPSNNTIEPKIEKKSKSKPLVILILFIFIAAGGAVAFFNKTNDNVIPEENTNITAEKQIIENSNKEELSPVSTVKKSDVDIFLEKALNTVSGNKYQLITSGSEEKVGRYNKAKVSYKLKWLNEEGNVYYTDDNLTSSDWSYFNTPSSWFEVLELIGVGGKVELYCPIESVIFRDTEEANKTAFFIELQLEGIIPIDENSPKQEVKNEEIKTNSNNELLTKQNTTIRKCANAVCDVLGLIPQGSIVIPLKENGTIITDNGWTKIEFTGQFCNNPKDKNCSSRSAIKTVEGWINDYFLE